MQIFKIHHKTGENMLNIFESISSNIKLTKAEKKFFEVLFKEQSRRMWIMAIDILRDRQAAEDVVQSSFVKLIEKVELLISFTDKDKLNGYVYVVTKNMALYQIRKQIGWLAARLNYPKTSRLLMFQRPPLLETPLKF